MTQTVALPGDQGLEQLSLGLNGEPVGPMIRPKSRSPPSDKTRLAVVDAKPLAKGMMGLGAWKKVCLSVRDGWLNIQHDPVVRSLAPQGFYGEVSPKFWKELAKACRRCPLNDFVLGIKRRIHYTPEVQILIEHQGETLTVTAGGTVFTFEDSGPYIPHTWEKDDVD